MHHALVAELVARSVAKQRRKSRISIHAWRTFAATQLMANARKGEGRRGQCTMTARPPVNQGDKPQMRLTCPGTMTLRLWHVSLMEGGRVRVRQLRCTGSAAAHRHAAALQLSAHLFIAPSAKRPAASAIVAIVCSGPWASPPLPLLAVASQLGLGHCAVRACACPARPLCAAPTEQGSGSHHTLRHIRALKWRTGRAHTQSNSQ